MVQHVSGYPAIGDVLGRYRIERTIGSGAMGQVFEASDLSLQRRVALKVISPSLAHDQEFRQRFLAEAQAMAALDSAHVVQVFNHGEDKGHLFIVTQLISGGDLGAMLRQRGVPPLPVALDIVAQAATGLADAHAAGLIHRDLKPSNVLVRDRGGRVQAYLADFGIARPLEESGAVPDGMIAGTPSAMSPELHAGGSASVASDIYGLGCVLWWAVAGRAPYAGSDDEVARAHRDAPVPQLPGASPQVAAVNEILRTAMAKSPAARYGSAESMRDALRSAAAMAGGPAYAGASFPAGSDGGTGGGTGGGVPLPQPTYPTAAPAGATAAAGASRGRGPLIAGVLAAVALVAALAVGGWWWSQRGDDEPDPAADQSSETTPTDSDTASPSDPTSSATTSDGGEEIPEDAVVNQVSAYVERMGFSSPVVTCDGPVSVGSGEPGHCEARANGQTGWVQVAPDLASGDLEFTPELPPEVLDREISKLFDKQGIDVPVQCTQSLLGVKGETMSCPVAESSDYGSVELKVTNVRDLLINFDAQLYYR